MKELTVAQAAEKLGISGARVRHLILDGRIKARHLNPRLLLIDPAELAKVRVRKPGRPKQKRSGATKPRGDHAAR
jgi:hypothetical protein